MLTDDLFDGRVCGTRGQYLRTNASYCMRKGYPACGMYGPCLFRTKRVGKVHRRQRGCCHWEHEMLVVQDNIWTRCSGRVTLRIFSASSTPEHRSCLLTSDMSKTSADLCSLGLMQRT